jgi:hypothetical protein
MPVVQCMGKCGIGKIINCRGEKFFAPTVVNENIVLFL